jgi:glycosyltransferase involved in cell wall biosynthesis
MTFHSPISQWKPRHRGAFRAAVSMADVVIGASEFTARQLRPWRPDVVTAPPSVDVAGIEITDPVDAASNGEQEFRIVGCGRLSREKDWGTLIQAVAMHGAKRTVTCDLIGGGPMRAELERLGDRSGCRHRVRLLGELPHQESLQRIAAADLFVLPSRFEGFGIAAVEAMALGVPTITADFPACSEYIRQGQTGHCFPAGDSAALAELIAWHVANPDASRSLGRRGRESVIGRYSAESSAELHHQLYLGSALSQTPRRTPRHPAETASDQVDK